MIYTKHYNILHKCFQDLGCYGHAWRNSPNYTHTHTYARTHARTHTRTHLPCGLPRSTRAYANAHTHTHTYTHTHTHTHWPCGLQRSSRAVSLYLPLSPLHQLCGMSMQIRERERERERDLVPAEFNLCVGSRLKQQHSLGSITYTWCWNVT